MESLRDSNVAVIRSFFAMASTTLVVAAVAILKEAVVAKSFGASDEFDAFVFSFSLVYFLPVLLTATLQGTFVPAFSGTLRLDAQRGWALASITLNVLSMGLVICSVLLLIGGNSVISLMAPGFGGTKRGFALSFLWSLLPTLVL